MLLLFWAQQGVAYVPITSTQTLQNPVNCALAGDQDDTEETRRKIQKNKRLMRSIFRE